jgi:hypothetical protein
VKTQAAVNDAMKATAEEAVSKRLSRTLRNQPTPREFLPEFDVDLSSDFVTLVLEGTPCLPYEAIDTAQIPLCLPLGDPVSRVLVAYATLLACFRSLQH